MWTRAFCLFVSMGGNSKTGWAGLGLASLSHLRGGALGLSGIDPEWLEQVNGDPEYGLLFCIKKHLAGKLFVISGNWLYVFLYCMAYSSVIFVLHDVKCKLTFQFWETHWRQEEATARPLSGMASDRRDRVSHWSDLVTHSLCLWRKLRPFKHLKQNFTPEIKVWKDPKSFIFFKPLENEIVAYCAL